MTWGMVGAAAVTVVGGYLNNKSAAKTASEQQQQMQTSQNKLDPRIENIVFGDSQRRLKPDAVPTGEDARGRPIYKDSDYIEGNKGLLDRYQGFLNQKQSAGADLYGKTADDFAGLNALTDMNAVRDSSYKLMNGNQAPQMTAAQSANPSRMQAAQGVANQTDLPTGYNVTNANAARARAATAGASNMQSSQINAPEQNSLGLKDAYDKFINGESGNNPYLTGAIQKGINQSKTAFENMQTDATRNLTENVLGNIRGGAIASGGYGGSRQGLAESNAVKDFSTQMGRAVSQFGQNNTDSAVSAQAGQYGQDQSNKLSALGNLSAQQYGVASQNAAMQQQSNQFNAANQQQANLFNAGNRQQANMTNAGNQQQTGMFNAGNANDAAKTQYGGLLSTNMNNTGAKNQFGMANLNNQQNANQINYSGDLNNSQFNAGLQQQANERNLGATMSTNDMNSRNAVAGSGLLQGQMNNNYNTANGWNNYALNNAGQVNGLLTPYLSANSSNTQSQPMYTNNGANALGWASLGLKAYDMFKPDRWDNWGPKDGL